MEVAEIYPESEDENDIEKHESLLQSLGVDAVKKQEKQTLQRTEASQDVSVFPLQDDNEEFDAAQLMSSLKNTANLNALRGQLNKVEKSSQHLKPALPRVQAERIERAAAFDVAKKTVSKWQPIINKNRKEEHLSFPLNQTGLTLETTDEFVAKFKPKTPLEKEIYEMLNGNKYVERKNNDLSIAEEEALKSISVEEARIRRAELQKHRALMSYHEAKNKRRNKIKSKSFRRIQRKQKEKKEIADFEKLEKENPEAAAEKLRKALLLRAEERAGQRHKQGSKWARNRRLIGKYDEMSRLQLDEQNKLHKERMQKTAVASEESDSHSETEEHSAISLVAPTTDIQRFEIAKNNPWLKHSEKEKTVEKSVNESVKKPQEVINLSNIATEVADDSESEGEFQQELKKIRQTIDEQKKNMDNNNNRKSKLEMFKEAFISLNTEDTKHKELMKDEINENKRSHKNPNKNIENEGDDVGLIISEVRRSTMESFDNISDEENTEIQTILPDSNNNFTKMDDTREYIDPNKVFTLPTSKINNDGVLVDDEENENKMTMQQAFADDDVVNNFLEEKDKLMEADAPKMDDSNLPGWGDWGGAGVLPTVKKQKKKRIRKQGRKPRKDSHLGHVIINQERNVHIAKYQINEVPFPFTSQEQYERSIRQPIGDTWNTPATVKSLTKPEVTTKLGTIIEPINEEEAFATKRKRTEKSTDEKSKRKKKIKKKNFENEKNDAIKIFN